MFSTQRRALREQARIEHLADQMIAETNHVFNEPQDCWNLDSWILEPEVPAAVIYTQRFDRIHRPTKTASNRWIIRIR